MSRGLGRHLAVAVAMAAAVVCSGCYWVGRYVANSLYGDLDVPIDREAAVTVAAFPPSPDIRAVIGGKGEGLDCSIPAILETTMFERVADAESPPSLQFRQACVFHDYCYRHGYATYHYAQADCDFSLLQQAFRTCIQIYDLRLYSASRSPEICRARAREVLLGVRAGGFGAFKAHEHSSYFEFDPMPMHADDYAVGRLARVDPSTAPRLDGHSLLSTPTTLHFRRGRLTSRQLRWNALDRLGDNDVYAGRAFPEYASPTPPTVVRAAGRDRYVWLDRREPHNTAFDVLIDDEEDGTVVFRRLPCPRGSPQQSVRVPCDLDAPVIRVVSPPDPTQPDVTFFAFTHRLPDGSVAKNRYGIGPVGLYRWAQGLDRADARSEVAVVTKLGELSDRYRVLQSEFHVGEFRKPGCRELVALGRGISMGPDGRPDGPRSGVGDGYQTMVTAVLIPLGASAGCPPAGTRAITLAQREEPAVPVSKGVGAPDVLLTLRAGDDGTAVRITEYGFTGTDGRTEATVRTVARGPQGAPIALDRSWVKSAAYVVKGGGRGDRLFFSRVVLDADQSRRFGQDQGPDYLRIELRYLEASDGGWVERGYSSCKVDLNLQHDLLPTNARLRDLHRRLAFEGVAPGREAQQAAAEVFKTLHKRELVRRWMQSQVIPGYIFDGEAAATDRALDAVVLFHGNADYSLLLQGLRDRARALDRLELRWPAREFAFARCL